MTGDEIRGCWEAWPAASLPEGVVSLTMAPARPPDDARQPLAFVEVTAPQTTDDDADTVAAGSAPATPIPATETEPGWSLWGELDA